MPQTSRPGSAGQQEPGLISQNEYFYRLQQNNAVSSDFDKIPGPTGMDIPDPLLASIIQNVV